MSNLIANIHNPNKEIIPILEDVSGEIHNFGIDLNARAKLNYSNSIISEINVSINENMENITEIIGENGSMKILDPWLPKNNIIEIHRNNQIEKIDSKSNLSIFANQINYFNDCAKNIQPNVNSTAMSLDNSVNYLKVLSDWKKILLKNENFTK